MGDDFETGRRWHDMGGDMRALRDPTIDRAGHELSLWEQRVDALVMVATAKGVFTVDGLRRALEDLGPQAFEDLSYYERWAQALAQNLVEAGVIAPSELDARMAEVQARGATYGDASAPTAPI